jgi:aryl-alcohol dehydrogenase-like predicted oxidoreductase
MEKLLKQPLGGTGIEVSPLGLGTVKFGRNEGVKYPEHFEIPSEIQLAALLAEAQEYGINLLDTAPAYGESEERLGRLLFAQRHEWVIAGKAGEDFIDGKSVFDFSPSAIEASLHRTLKRLGTDYLDIFLIHSDGNDMEVLSDELITAMQDFKSRGLVRAIGVSTKTLKGGLKTLEEMDIAMVTYNQDYNEEEGVLDYAATHNKGTLIKKALASGHASSPAEAIKYALSHRGVGSLIVGTINPDHLRDNVEAALSA